MEYAVVDLKERRWKVFAEKQSAWSAWQNCWIPGNAMSMDRYTQGKVCSMKKYLNPATPLPLGYRDDGLPSNLNETT